MFWVITFIKNRNINKKNTFGNILTHRNNINTNRVNGKEILDTDINDVFGEQTIYKNYPKDAINIKGKKNNLSRNLFD